MNFSRKSGGRGRGLQPPPPFVSESEERAALSLLSAPPSPSPSPGALSSRVRREHLVRVERAVWKLQFRAPPLPFVALSAEEASAVTRHGVARWSNRKVRVVGHIEHDAVPWLVSAEGKWSAVQSRVALDLSVVSLVPPFETLIEVFGTLSIHPQADIPELQVMFFRRLQSEYLRRFQRAREARRRFEPLFVRARPHRGQRRRRLLRPLDGDAFTSEDEGQGDEPLCAEAALLNPFHNVPLVKKMDNDSLL